MKKSQILMSLLLVILLLNHYGKLLLQLVMEQLPQLVQSIM